MKEDKKDEFTLGIKSGVMMLAELLLSSLEVGVALGYDKFIPLDVIEKFIKVYAVTISNGELDFDEMIATNFDEMIATIKEGAVEAKQHVDGKSGVVH